MSKRRAGQKRTTRRGLQDVLISLGILLTSILLIIKYIWGGISWLEVFTPVMIVFFIYFLLAVLKIVYNKL